MHAHNNRDRNRDCKYEMRRKMNECLLHATKRFTSTFYLIFYSCSHFANKLEFEFFSVSVKFPTDVRLLNIINHKFLIHFLCVDHLHKIKILMSWTTFNLTDSVANFSAVLIVVQETATL